MLEEILRELEQVWAMQAAPLTGCLAAGLPRNSADALAATYGLELPADVAEFFGWHDGLRPDRDRDIEMLPALRPVSLEEALQLQDALKDAFAILPEPVPLLAGHWLPILTDDAGSIWLVSAEAGADRCVYALDLEDLGSPEVRFDSLAAMALALTELFRSGSYVFDDGAVHVSDARAAAAIVAAHNRHGDDSGDAERAGAGAGETATNAASHDLAATLAAMDGTRRALRILDAVTELGFDAVIAAITRLDVAARDDLARSLGTVADRGSASLLVHLLADPEDFVRETAAGAIGQTGEPAAADALLPLVGSANHNIRKAAAFSLGELHVSAAVEPLLTMTGDPNAAVRAAAATALGKIGGRMDIEPLLQLLDDPYPDAAQMAAWTLGEIGDPTAAPALERAAGSKDAALARIARAALEQLQREM